MSHGASLYSPRYNPLIPSEVLHGISRGKGLRPGTIKNSKPARHEIEAQLAMDRLLREYLARKSLGEVKGAPANYGVPCRHLPRCLIAQSL